MTRPLQLPVRAIATGPGCRGYPQQPGSPARVVVGMNGDDHHEAARSAGPFGAGAGADKTAETSCHGGTCRPEGFEISRTPLERTTSRTAVLVEGECPPSWRARS